MGEGRKSHTNSSVPTTMVGAGKVDGINFKVFCLVSQEVFVWTLSFCSKTLSLSPKFYKVSAEITIKAISKPSLKNLLKLTREYIKINKEKS